MEVSHEQADFYPGVSSPRRYHFPDHGAEQTADQKNSSGDVNLMPAARKTIFALCTWCYGAGSCGIFFGAVCDGWSTGGGHRNVGAMRGHGCVGVCSDDLLRKCDGQRMYIF